MWTDYHIQAMESLGCKIELKPVGYSQKNTTYLLTLPDGRTLETYANWVDMQYDYDAGLIHEGDEGGVAISNPEDFLNGPGDTFDNIWDYQDLPEAGEGSFAFHWILFIFAMIIFGFVATWIFGSIDSILHPCTPSMTDIGANKKLIVEPNCHTYTLDIVTGEVKQVSGGTNDWIILVVLGVVAVAGIWLLSSSGILKGIGGSSGSSSGGGGPSGHWGFIQNA